MLVRALKVLWFSCRSIDRARTIIATAALFSRAMKAGLMAEQAQFGNDEPSNQLPRLMS
jgi:hypothetical protein